MWSCCGKCRGVIYYYYYTCTLSQKCCRGSVRVLRKYCSIDTRWCEHITLVLRQLHWLPVRQCIHYKLTTGAPCITKTSIWLPYWWLPARGWLWSTDTTIIGSLFPCCTTLQRHVQRTIVLCGLAHVCGMTCPNISATSDFQSTLLANVSKCYCSLLHQAAVHFWQFWFLCAIYKCTYLLSGRIFIDEYRKHQHRWLDSAQCGREYLVVDFNFRWAELPIVFSLSGFANLSTKVTNQRVFRLSLFFLLTENSQWFQSAKVKVNYCLKSVEV